MTELAWQSTLLLVGAFFLGAVVACGLKRRFYYGTGAKAAANAAAGLTSSPAPATPNADQPKIEVSAAPAAPATPSAPAAAPASPAAPAAAPAPAPAVAEATPLNVAPVKAQPAVQLETPSPAPVVPAPAPAATPAPAPAAPTPLRPTVDRSDVASLRSVRSEALRGEDSGKVPSGGVDDLKRIRGVGVLIERKLNSLGITKYEQIANWTGADIVRISQILDFKGRIERENWIEQARILATGGQTEFSRRINRANA